MAIADEDIEKIRSTVSIVDVIGQHVQLKRTGRNWVGLCPFHGEKTPSFNVREEMGRYRCFGCDRSGDVFNFVQEIDHLDFVGAVEQLANRAGISLTYTDSGQSKRRDQRKKLTTAMGESVEWYHRRLLEHADAGAARAYLRSRGFDSDSVRRFQLGWAPDEWDALSKQSGINPQLLQENGLSFRNRAGRLQDAFRARVLFPIFSENGEPLAFGGRILPGSADPAKYKNSPETPIYTKSRTLYGLNWAKADIVAAGEAIVCEGYTDVIGFFRAGIPRAVATCGTAFTEEHVRLLKRYASKVVLAFDADAAGQGAAERFYEWEEKYEISVRVASFPGGQDPGQLAEANPDALARAVEGATPFLGFRLARVLEGRSLDSPEERARLGTQAMAVVNEHPNVNIRKLYAGEVAAQVGIPAADLMRSAERRERRPHLRVQAPRREHHRSHAEFVAIALLVQNWNSVAEWMVEALFDQNLYRRAFLALAESGGDLVAALDTADPEARDVLDRAAVIDLDAQSIDPETEMRNLIASAVRRELARPVVGELNSERVAADRDARVLMEGVANGSESLAEAAQLLVWLEQRMGISSE